MQALTEFLVQLLDDLTLMMAQMNRKEGLVGYEGYALLAKAADPAMRREFRRQAAACARGHFRQQPGLFVQFRMKGWDE